MVLRDIYNLTLCTKQGRLGHLMSVLVTLQATYTYLPHHNSEFMDPAARHPGHCKEAGVRDTLKSAEAEAGDQY